MEGGGRKGRKRKGREGNRGLERREEKGEREGQHKEVMVTEGVKWDTSPVPYQPRDRSFQSRTHLTSSPPYPTLHSAEAGSSD